MDDKIKIFKLLKSSEELAKTRFPNTRAKAPAPTHYLQNMAFHNWQ